MGLTETTTTVPIFIIMKEYFTQCDTVAHLCVLIVLEGCRSSMAERNKRYL